MPIWMRDLQVLRSNENVFWNQARSIYYLPGTMHVGGYFRTDQRFTFLSVPKAGHFVPTTNMEVTRAFLRDYLSKERKLKCYHPMGCSTAQTMCGFMSVPSGGSIPTPCSGHGFCDDVVTG